MTENEQVLEVPETTNVGEPSAPETVESLSPTTDEQQPETPELEAPATEDKPEAEAQTWEGFEIKAPEHSDGEVVSAFAKAMQDNGMTPEGAQKALDGLAEVMRERSMAELNAFQESEIAKSKEDALIGGDQFDENMAIASKGAEAFGDEEFAELLKPISEGGQGLGNIAAISRLLYRVGKAIKPGTKVVSGSAPLTEKSAAQSIFDNSGMNE